jgi:hypothetical protein
LEIKIESAALRREVSENKGSRIHSVYGVTVEEGCSSNARELASAITSTLDTDVKIQPLPIILGEAGSGMIEIRITDINSEKLIWTTYNTRNGSEIGPRIRISEVRRVFS